MIIKIGVVLPNTQTDS